MKQFPSEATNQSIWSFNTRRIVTAGALVAITIIMGLVPNIGFIPVPNLSGRATIEHVPTILGAVLEGPVVGMVTGLVFGMISFLTSTIPLFKDPLVSVLPRILIGLTSWLVFAGLKNINKDLAAFASGFVGAATNTVFVLWFAVLRGLIPVAVIVTIIPQAVVEAIIAAIITVVVARAVYVVRSGQLRAKETKSREELPY